MGQRKKAAMTGFYGSVTPKNVIAEKSLGLEVAYAAALRRTSDAVTQRAEMDQHHGLETRKVSVPTTKAHRPRAECARDVERAQALDVQAKREPSRPCAKLSASQPSVSQSQGDTGQGTK